MRLRNNPRARNFLKQSNIVIKSFPFAPRKVATLELGMGKGQMITTLAKANPDEIYIGLEKNATVACRALKKAAALRLTNFLIVHNNASELSTMFQGKFQTIWLTFSDPWPKARHKKRRLTSRRFLALYEEILTPGGLVKLKTDNDAFFSYSVTSFQSAGWIIVNITNDLSNSAFAAENVTTEYEEKWSRAGKKINYLEARK